MSDSIDKDGAFQILSNMGINTAHDLVGKWNDIDELSSQVREAYSQAYSSMDWHSVDPGNQLLGEWIQTTQELLQDDKIKPDTRIFDLQGELPGNPTQGADPFGGEPDQDSPENPASGGHPGGKERQGAASDKPTPDTDRSGKERE